LSDFNRRGMDAIQGWMGIAGYADGGLVIPDAARPNTRAFEPAANPGSSTNVSLQQRLLPVLDDDLIADALRGPKGEELIVMHISRNPGKFRSLLRV
jgi:hypothetical protein